MESTSVYRSLADSEIRLISLLPASFNSALKNGIRCSFICLGDFYDDEENKILISTESFGITRNLFAALQHIRHSTEPITLWIDAICINQNDNTERGTQVLLMRKIYECAHQVISWLGTPSINLGVIDDLLNELDRGKAGRLTATSILTSAFDSTKLEKWRAVLCLLTNEYWERIWIIQEVVCARQVKLQCGHHSISWIDLSRIASVLVTNMQMVYSIPELRAAHLSDVTMSARLGVLQRRWNNEHAGFPLLSLIRRARKHYCSDPRDKIYALLGLSNGAITIDIDYNLPPQHAYLQATKMIIVQTQRLEVICDFPSLRLSKCHPSWCPDWSQDRVAMSLGTNVAEYCADLASDANAVFSADGKILSCIGFCIGVVKRLGDQYWEPEYFLNLWSEEKKQCVLEWLGIAMWDPPEETSKKDWEDIITESFWRTLIGGTRYNSDGLSPKFYRHLFDVARGVEKRPQTNSDQASDFKDEAYQRLAKQRDSNVTEEEQIQRYIARFTAKTFAMMVNRRFFSAGGKMMGLGHHKTKLGDRICILYGCSRPVILRKIGEDSNNDHLVGDAYVEGFMFGEAMKGIDDGSFTKEEFHFE